MMTEIKHQFINLIKKIFRPLIRPIRRIKVEIIFWLGQKSYSQEGEDRILASLLFRVNGNKADKPGFYVDIGAHHPFRFSNTYLFYRCGWRGLNIDAMPGSMQLFKIFRSRDINLEVGIGKNTTSLDFYIFNEPAINTFDSNLALERNNGSWYIKEIRKIPVMPLSLILEKHIPKNTEIEFMTIDVEGMDLNVLQSNNWNLFRPKIILIEVYGTSINKAYRDPAFKFLEQNGYTFCSKTVNTLFFVETKLLNEES